MSAYCNLAGLFPPKGDQVWNNNLGTLWQPIPVQTSPVLTDNVSSLYSIIIYVHTFLSQRKSQLHERFTLCTFLTNLQYDEAPF